MLTELRQSLVAALSELDYEVHDVMPPRMNPPAILVRSSQNGSYVQKGQFPGEVEVSLDVWAVVRQSDMATEQAELDAMVEAILNAELGWAFQGAEGTRLATFPDGDLPVVIVHFATQDKL